MMNTSLKDEIDIILSTNTEDWRKLVMLLQNPEGTGVYWINCDTDLIKHPIHDALTAKLPQLKPFDIHIDKKTVSLKQILLAEGERKIPEGSLIHIFGIESAAQSEEFRANLNFDRDSIFRKSPGNVLFWGDFATSTILSSKTYDFWSWMSITFDFTTPSELLTARQKGFSEFIQLQDRQIRIPDKNSVERIRQLEHEYEETLKAMGGKPTTERQMSDLVVVISALSNDYKDEGAYSKAIMLMESALSLDEKLMSQLSRIRLSSLLFLNLLFDSQIERAKNLGEIVLSNASKLLKEGDVDLVQVQSNLAQVYSTLKDFNRAKELLEEANKSINNTEANNDPYLLLSLAIVYDGLGNSKKSLELLNNVLENRTALHGANHPDIALVLHHLSYVHYGMGNFFKAKELLESVIEIDKNNFGEFHVRMEKDYCNLACIYERLNDLNSAKEYILKAIESGRKSYDENHPRIQGDLKFLKQLEDRILNKIPKIHFHNTPQNSPCPCGSGKKYKRCHGAK